jgi:hypothetical protein
MARTRLLECQPRGRAHQHVGAECAIEFGPRCGEVEAQKRYFLAAFDTGLLIDDENDICKSNHRPAGFAVWGGGSVGSARI